MIRQGLAENMPPDFRGEISPDAFWRFSLAFYGRPGVAAALLKLQDTGGHDVNLVLFALWQGAVLGRRLDSAALASAAAAIEPVTTTVTGPLRELRRHLPAAAANDLQQLRRCILALELQAERCTQHRLVRTTESRAAAPAEASAAKDNLALVLGRDAECQEAALLRRTLDSLSRAASAET